MMRKNRRVLNAGPTYGTQSAVQVADIAFGIHDSVEARFFEVLRPKHEWYQWLNPDQVISNINVGATNYAYITRDKRGAAAFIGSGPNANIPMVAQSAGAVSVPIGYSAVGARVTQEDARQYAMGFNGNLATDLGEAMREACDNLVEKTVLFGNADLGFLPILNYSGVHVAAAASVGAAPDDYTDWASKTSEEIVKDICDVLAYVVENTRTLFAPNEIFLPISQFGIITQKPMVLGGVNLAMTIEQYVKKNNLVTAMTGKELSFKISRYLSTAGADGGARAVFMDRSPDFQMVPFPLPYSLTPPIPVPLAAEWYAEQKFGSFHVRQLGSMCYLDGI
jgi:hypothetical protein